MLPGICRLFAGGVKFDEETDRPTEFNLVHLLRKNDRVYAKAEKMSLSGYQIMEAQAALEHMKLSPNARLCGMCLL